MTFGSARAKVAAKSVRYLSPGALSVTTPKGTGLTDVRVSTARGTSAKTKVDQYFLGSAPAVKKVSPEAGPVAGGPRVAITGSGFDATR